MTPEFGDGRCGAVDFLGGEFRIHRQGEDFARNVFRIGEIAWFVAEIRIERLQVQRNWIIDGAADFSIGQEFLKGVATIRTNRVLMEDVLVTFGRDRSANPRDI